jgi:16S rRNA (cytosine1402-N4)-methyltransferase
MKAYHIPVLLEASLAALNLQPEGTYVDTTFGGGSYSRELLSRIADRGRLFAFDQDVDALDNTIIAPNFELIIANYSELVQALQDRGITAIDGLVADLGISAHQINTAQRGFSYRMDAPLDMRMSPEIKLNAQDILNEYDAVALSTLFMNYGELSNAYPLATHIARTRMASPIRTTFDLNAVVMPFAPRNKEFKFLSQLYQAIRIEVNQELEHLKALLEQSLQVIQPGGRIVIISYHSLEDRMVKKFLQTGNIQGIMPKDFYGNKLSPWTQEKTQAIGPDAAELAANPSSRSAKLRYASRNNLAVVQPQNH